MKSFLKSKRFAALIVAAVLILALMGYAGSIDRPTTAPQRFIVSVMTPMLRLSEASVGNLLGYFDNVLRADDIAKENTGLKSEIASLQKQVVLYEDMLAETQQSAQAEALAIQFPQEELIAATVVGRDPISGFEQFTLDVGSESGVVKGDIVISENGLCGIVDEVGIGFSTVRTILSPSLNVSALLSSCRETGIVTGEASRVERDETTLTLLSASTEASISELVVTSGEGGVFPEGLIIGTVASLELSIGGKTMTAVLDTAEDISRVSSVFVISNQGIED